MDPLSVELRLLTDLRGGGLRLSEGRGLMARVMAADDSGRGMLSIAGAVIEAQLPRGIKAGDELRLVVRQADEHHLVLELAQPAPSTPPAATAALALPGGGQLRIGPDEDAEAARPPAQDGVHRLSLSYDTPTLGTLDLRFELGPSALRVTIAAPAGDALTLAGENADQLRAGLHQAAERPVTVTVIPRRQPLDLYA